VSGGKARRLVSSPAPASDCDRVCGPCNACCNYPAVPVLKKPAYVLCDHASLTGCGIYGERPPECAAYTCLWLDGEFSPSDRPDQIGFAFDRPTWLEEHADYEGIQAICARELWQEARSGERARDLLRRLSSVMVVRLTAWGGGTQLMGPSRWIQLLSQRAAERGAE
jgi:hypothetical protein